VWSHVATLTAGLTTTAGAFWYAGATPFSAVSFLCGDDPLSTAKTIGESMYSAAEWSKFTNTVVGAGGVLGTAYGAAQLAGDGLKGAKSWWNKPGPKSGSGSKK
jgi:hypothetical protein